MAMFLSAAIGGLIGGLLAGAIVLFFLMPTMHAVADMDDRARVVDGDEGPWAHEPQGTVDDIWAPR